MLAIVAVAQFMVILDASIVNVALPTIKRDVGFSEQSLSWILNAYTLTFGGFLLRRAGRRRSRRAGMTSRARSRSRSARWRWCSR
jgi:MFS family permease